MLKLQTTAGGETLGFDYTFDMLVEVAAAVCKYRHDRWKLEWGKPHFTRLDVAIGSFATGVVPAASLPMSAVHLKRLNCAPPRNDASCQLPTIVAVI
jgi:hypothetical protein